LRSATRPSTTARSGSCHGSHKTAFDADRFDDAKFFRSDRTDNADILRSAESPHLASGDAVFFHCNTLHSAGKNRSDAVKFSLSIPTTAGATRRSGYAIRFESGNRAAAERSCGAISSRAHLAAAALGALLVLAAGWPRRSKAGYFRGPLIRFVASQVVRTVQVDQDLEDLYFLTGVKLINTGRYRLAGKVTAAGPGPGSPGLAASSGRAMRTAACR